MAKSLPKRQTKSRTHWFYSPQVNVAEVLKEAEAMLKFGTTLEDICVCADAGYETADLYLQVYTPETDDEYAESCAKHEKLHEMIKKNKAKQKDKEYQTFLRLKKKFEKNE